MSESNSMPPAPPSPPSKPDRSSKPSNARKWRRRLMWTLIVIVGVIVLFRIIIVFALPPVLRAVAGRYGLTCNYERLELYLVDGDVGLTHVTIAPKEGGQNLIATDYCRADVSALNLLRGRLVLRRIEADGIELDLERTPDGRVALLEHLAQVIGDSSKNKQTTAADAQARDIDLTSPLQIDAFRLQHIRARIHDLAVTPAVETQLEMDIRLTDLAAPDRPTRFEVDIASVPILDLLKIEGMGTSHGKDVDATMRLTVRGLRPRPTGGYLEPLGLRPVARDINASMLATIKTSAVLPPTSQSSGKTQAELEKGAPIKGTLQLSNIEVDVDGEEALALQRLTLDADSINYNFAKLAKLTIEGARAHAKRSEVAPSLAGVEYVGTSAKQKSSSPSTQPAMAIMPWSLGELLIQDAQATLRDTAITPAAQLAFNVRQLSVKGLNGDPKQPDAKAQIAGEFEAPGVAKSIQLTGDVAPFAAKKTIALKINTEGIRPEAIKPYLDALGLESTLKSAAFTCDLSAAVTPAPDGSMSADAKLDGIHFSDGDNLIVFNQVHITGLATDADLKSIKLGAMEVSGPELAAHRDESGVISVLGMRVNPSKLTLNRSAAPSASVSTGPATQPISPASLPKLKIDRLVWTDIKLQLDDAAVSPPAKFALADAGVELSDIQIDPDPKSTAGVPGKIKAWLKAPGVADDLTVDGTIVPQPSGPILDVDVTGSGISAAKLEPYLKGTGIEPMFDGGTLKVHVKAAISRPSDDTLAASLDVNDFSFTDAKGELVAADVSRVDGVHIGPNEIVVDSIELNRPRTIASRLSNGALVIAGVQLTQGSVPQDTKEFFTAATRPTTSPFAAMPVAHIKKIRVKDASVDWADAAVAPAASAKATVSVDLDDLVVGRDSEPAKLKLVAKADGSLDEMLVTGTLLASPQKQSLHADVSATGLRAGPLAPYIPPGVLVALKDGRLKTTADLSVEEISQGGRSASLLVSGLNYTDAGDVSLLKLDDFRVAVSRLDLFHQVVSIDEISLHGLETDIQKTPDGAIRLLGVTLGSPEAAKARPATAPAEAAKPDVGAPASAPAAQVEQLVARGRGKPSLITLGKLDLNVKRASVRDESRPESAPVSLIDVNVHNLKPIELLGDDPGSRPPVEIEATGKIDPLAQSFKINTQTAPFAQQPTLVIDVLADGIHGDGITAILPELKELIDGTPLTDGQFKMHLDAQAKFDRRRPWDFDVSHGLDAEFTLKPLEFRGTPDGPILAGLDEIHSEGIRVTPANGDIRIKSLEITKPIANLYKDDAGIHALGCIVKLPKVGATQPSDASASTEPTTAPAESMAAATPPPAPAKKPSSEVRIDKILVSGADVRYEDRTAEPVFVAPINGLDVEIRDVSTLAPWEDRPPTRFNVLVSSGKVDVIKKDGTTDQRELFSQITSSGRISMYPALNGYAKTSVSGLELGALRGPAKSMASVTLGGGVFDSSTDIRFKGNNSFDSRSKFLFTDLRLSEPPNGPIQQNLKLNAPLDVVIVMLEDPSGGITVPLDVPVAEGQLSKSAIMDSAIGALAQVLAVAVASSPIKLVGGMLPAPEKKDAGEEAPLVVTFAPGDASIDPGAVQQELAPLVERMRKEPKLELKLQHQLGGGDVSRIAVRANPAPEDCLNLTYRLRQRKMDLLAARAEAAGQARGELAAGATVNAFGGDEPSVSRLRAIDRELAKTEDALDRMYDMLRPGAERQTDRRTRAACIDFGQERLDEVRRALVDALQSGATEPVPNLADRIHVSRAQFAETQGTDGGKVTLVPSGKPKK